MAQTPAPLVAQAKMPAGTGGNAQERNCQNIERDDGALRRSMGWSRKTLRKASQISSLGAQQLCMLSKAERDKVKALAKQQIAADANGMLEYLRGLQKDRSGKVPLDGLLKAIQARQALLAAHSRHQAASANSATSISNWAALGPVNSFSGRITALHIDPRNSLRVVAGTSSGGIWYTSDGGATWKSADSFFTASAIRADASQPDILYASSSNSLTSVAGLWRSSDNGASWRLLPGLMQGQTVPGRAPAHDTVLTTITDFAISPVDARLIVASTSRGLLFSRDGGTNWQQIAADQLRHGENFGPPETTFVSFDPKDGRRLLAGTYHGNLITGTALGSASESWQFQAVAPGDTFVATLAWSGDGNSAWIATGENGGTVMRSDDGGQSFHTIANPKYCDPQCTYNNSLWVDPTNPNRLTLGGVSLHRSLDGGITWADVSFGKDGSFTHYDNHAVVADPGFDGKTNKTVYFGNDGGIFRTRDIFAPQYEVVWENFGRGINATEFYAFDTRASAGELLGGTQDNGTFQYLGRSQWNMISGGDGGYPAIPATGTPYYTSYQNLIINRLENSASFPQVISAGIVDNPLFIAPLLLDPNQGQRMYAGATGLWVCDDVRANTPLWRKIKPTLDRYLFIQTIAVAPGNPDIVWVGYTDGSIHRTRNARASSPDWELVRPFQGSFAASSIYIADANAQRVTVSFASYTDGTLLARTYNGAASWIDISGNLPKQPVMSVVEHPDDSNLLYAGTATGLYLSDNGGASWQAINDGPAQVAVMMLKWYDKNTLLAATYGRGVWRAHLGPLTAPAAPIVGIAHGSNGAAQVDFKATGINDGGSPITSYTVTASPGGKTATGSTSPLTVTGLVNGMRYTFTVTANNAIGASAPSSKSNTTTPLAVVTEPQTVAAGSLHSAAISSDGSLWAWGANFHGQIGNGSYDNHSQAVFIGKDFASVAAGFAHTVAIKRDGSLWAWGLNDDGQLGDGSTTKRNSPVLIGNGYVAVAAGQRHSVGLKADGSLWAWGDNQAWQIGDGSTTTQIRPVLIGKGYAAISAQGYYSLGLKTDNSLWGWGIGGTQFGDGNFYPHKTPTALGNIWIRNTAGYYHGAAIDNDGALWTWGDNQHGQLGTGILDTELRPRSVGSGFKVIAGGESHTLAIKSNGTLYAWGDNTHGQLGDGSKVDQLNPVSISSKVIAIAASGHSIAMKEDGSILTFGKNDYGQLGDGSLIQRNQPVTLTLPNTPGTPAQAFTLIGQRSDYTLRPSGSGFIATNNATGSSSRVFSSQERLLFNDLAVSLDIGADAQVAQIYRLYQAAFNRVPDKSGLGYWISRLDNAVPTASIANAFIQSAEFKAAYGSNPGNETLINAMYANVLHRSPDAGGFAYWLDRMKNGITPTDLLRSFSDSDENRKQVQGAIGSGIEYQPYIAVP